MVEDFLTTGQSAEAAVGYLVVYCVVLVIALIACFLLAIIPSKIAKKKGYSGAGFYWFGVAVLPAAIIVACVLKNKLAPQAQQAPQEPQQPKDPGPYQS